MELDNFVGIKSVLDFFNQSRHIGRIFINRLWNITNLFKGINKVCLFLIRTLPLALLSEIVTIFRYTAVSFINMCNRESE